MEEKLHLSPQYIRQTSFLLSYLMTEKAQKWDLASAQEEQELIDWQTKHFLCCSHPDGLQGTPYSFLMGYHCFLPTGRKIVAGCISDSTVIPQMHSLYPWKPNVPLCPPQVQYMERQKKKKMSCQSPTGQKDKWEVQIDPCFEAVPRFHWSL